MKKLLTSFLALVAVCLAALPGNSQTITIEGGGDTTCGSLEEAMAAAEDGGVILLSGEYELPKRLTATKNITIKGDGSAVIKRKDKNNLMFLDAENCAFTLSNLTIDGANLESGKALMEFSNNDKNKIENVKIINAINTANSGLIQVKSSNKKPGGAHINGMTVENCSILEGYGDVFVGRNALYISGDNNFSIFCEKTYRVNVEGELTNKVPLVINIDGSREDAKAIVIGSKDPSKFYAPAGEFVPKSNGTEMSLSKSTADGEYKRHIFLNGIGYYTFDSVVAAVQPGETIEIDGEVVMGTSRSELGNVTIKGISEDAVLKRNKEFQKLMWKLTGDLNLENITIDGNTENGNDGVLIELNAGNNTFTNVKFCNVTKVGSNECLVQVKQGCRSLALNNVAVENCDAASARGAIQIDGNCGANVTASGLDDLSFLVGGTRFVTLSDLDNAAKIVLYADANRQDGSVIVKGTSDVAAVEHANFYLEADSKNNQLVYYATEPFAFNEVIGDALVVNHIYKTYAPNSSKHEAGEYSIQLPRDATFFNLPVEGLTATLAADESVWTVNNWDGVVPEGEVAEAYHAANHWRYHKAEVKEVSASKVDFEAAQAGRYVLTLSLPETYNGSVKGERSKTYAIEVVPAVKVADFSDHKAPEGVSNKDLLFSEEALNNVKIYVVDGNNNETIVAVHEKTAGWALTANEGIDLTNCRVATKYGSRNILYQVTETPAAAEEDIEDEYLAPAFRSVNTEGYADAADGIDLSNAKSLSLIQKVNGVYSDPINITFAEEPIETGVKSIEAAEEAAEAEYFTLEGIRAELPLAPGAYVCRRGQKANVIMVK